MWKRNRHFQRAGIIIRIAMTTTGEHKSILYYSEITAATGDDPTYFRPLEDSSNSTGSAFIEGIFRSKVPNSLRRSAFAMPSSAATASLQCPRERRLTAESVSMRASSMTSFVVGFLRGTKCHSQEDHCTFHDVNVTLGQINEDNQHIAPSNPECWLTKAVLDEPDSGNILGNSQSSAKTRRMRMDHHLFRIFPETRKRHATAYRTCRHSVGYGRTLNVQSIGGGTSDSGRGPQSVPRRSDRSGYG